MGLKNTLQTICVIIFLVLSFPVFSVGVQYFCSTTHIMNINSDGTFESFDKHTFSFNRNHAETNKLIFDYSKERGGYFEGKEPMDVTWHAQYKDKELAGCPWPECSGWFRFSGENRTEDGSINSVFLYVQDNSWHAAGDFHYSQFFRGRIEVITASCQTNRFGDR